MSPGHDPRHRPSRHSGPPSRADLTIYLADNIGGDLNVLRSHEHNASDRLLTFNGVVD